MDDLYNSNPLLPVCIPVKPKRIKVGLRRIDNAFKLYFKPLFLIYYSFAFFSCLGYFYSLFNPDFSFYLFELLFKSAESIQSLSVIFFILSSAVFLCGLTVFGFIASALSVASDAFVIGTIVYYLFNGFDFSLNFLIGISVLLSLSIVSLFSIICNSCAAIYSSNAFLGATAIFKTKPLLLYFCYYFLFSAIKFLFIYFIYLLAG